MNEQCLLIIDSNSVLHRAYHALPPLSSKKGELVNAVYGFLLVFLKAVNDFKPDFIVSAFDYPAKTFRYKIYKKYKAKRPPIPKDLVPQVSIIKDILNAFNISIYEKKDFEADDIIGTISYLVSRQFGDRQIEDNSKQKIKPRVNIIVLSGDFDILQLVDSRVRVYILKKGVKNSILYNEELVREKFKGLSPKQILDFKALRGDTSDNIPGVTGVGEKTATKLLLRFGSLKNLYDKIENSEKNIDGFKQSLIKTLIKYKKQAFLSRDLALIRRDVPINFNLKECLWKKYNKKRVIELFNRFGFYSLISRLPSLHSEVDSKPNQSDFPINKINGRNLKLL